MTSLLSLLERYNKGRVSGSIRGHYNIFKTMTFVKGKLWFSEYRLENPQKVVSWKVLGRCHRYEISNKINMLGEQYKKSQQQSLKTAAWRIKLKLLSFTVYCMNIAIDSRYSILYCCRFELDVYILSWTFWKITNTVCNQHTLPVIYYNNCPSVILTLMGRFKVALSYLKIHLP